MIGRAAILCLAMLCFASLSPVGGEAKVLAGGYLVKAEWLVLCGRSPEPIVGTEATREKPLHRRVELPPAPRRICHFEAEARFVDPNQRGRIDVTLRGHVAKSPLER